MGKNSRERGAITLKIRLYVIKHTNFVEIICHLPKNIFLTLRSEIEVCSFYSTTQSVYLFSVCRMNMISTTRKTVTQYREV